jgi:hypothetical protein
MKIRFWLLNFLKAQSTFVGKMLLPIVVIFESGVGKSVALSPTEKISEGHETLLAGKRSTSSTPQLLTKFRTNFDN